MPSITSVNHTLGNGKGLVTQNDVTSEDKVRGSSKQSNKGLSRATSFVAKAVASLALLMPLIDASSVDAANNPEREKAVAKFGDDSWAALRDALKEDKLKDLPNARSLWNNIKAVLHVSDDTKIEAVDALRKELISTGIKNSNIPPEIVHEAIYTTSVVAQSINKDLAANNKTLAELDKKMAELATKSEGITKNGGQVSKEMTDEKAKFDSDKATLIAENKTLEGRLAKIIEPVVPFMGKIIVDATKEGGKEERFLVRPSEVGRFYGGDNPFFRGPSYEKVKVYNSNNFENLAAYTLAQAGEKGFFEKVGRELLTSGNDEARRDEFFNIFKYTGSDVTLPKDVVEKSKEWIYGRKQMEAFNKGDAAAAEPASSNTDIEFEIIEPDNAKDKAPVDKGVKDSQPVPPGSTVIVLPPGTEIGTAKKHPTPDVPRGASYGSIEELRKINEKLVKPLLPYPYSKSASDQGFIADNVLMLAKHGDELALPACAQWFAIKSYSEGSSGGGFFSSASPADMKMLEALSIMAQKDEVAFTVLERYIGSFPKQFERTFLYGTYALWDSPQKRAGAEMIKALNLHKDNAKNLVTALSNKETKLIWPEPMSDTDVEHVNKLRDAGRSVALMIMAFDDQAHNFTPYLRDIVKNDFAKDMEKFVSMIGVALAKDKESVEPLLNIAIDETKPMGMRELALDAVLFIDRPDLIPAAIREKEAEGSPFTGAKLRHFFPNLIERTKPENETDFCAEVEGKNPFQARIKAQYDRWLTLENAAIESAKAKGGAPGTITDAQKLGAFIELRERELGGTGIALAGRAGDATFSSKYVKPMVNYLKDHRDIKKPLYWGIAYSMMDVLGKSNATEAAPLFRDMATYPEIYVQDNSRGQGFFGFFDVLFNNFEMSLIKANAIKNLGGVVDLKNPASDEAKALHLVALKDSALDYRWMAQKGQRELARRYDSAMAGLKPGDAAFDVLSKARAAHASEMVGQMQYHAEGREYETQMRLFDLREQFMLAKGADMMGGTKDLVMLAHEASKKDTKAPVIRTVMHALFSNGKGVDEIKALGFPADVADNACAMYKMVNEQEYWLGKKEDRKFTGEGVEVAIVDGGYVYPLDIKGFEGLKERIVYPEKLVTWSDLTTWLDLHPTMVASTLHKAAPASASDKIHSYSFMASIPETPFRPWGTQDSALYALEDIAQNKIAGESNVELINYSWGYINFILANEKMRSDFIDIASAYMETLSKINTMHTVAAGNEHGAFPAFVRYGSVGELNALGLRMDSNNKFTKPDGVFYASAMDKYADRLAEFTSKQDPLRAAEAITMLSFQGVHVLVPYPLDGAWDVQPVNGTSFAAPNNEAVLAWGLGARKKLGLPELSASDWETLLQRSNKHFPQREDWEGGKYFDATQFMKDATTFKADAKQPAVAEASK